MVMDPARLPRNRKAFAAPAVKAPPARAAKAPAPSAGERPETPADLKGPHLPAPAAPTSPAAPASPSRVEGLDALSLELVHSAPLIPVGATAPPTSVQPPDTAPAAPGARPGLKAPTVLVVLGGTVAAGLLLALGLRKPDGRGYSTAAGRTAAAIPTPMPTQANIPTPSAWLKAGGS